MNIEADWKRREEYSDSEHFVKIAIRFVQIFDMNKDICALTTTVTNERYLIDVRTAISAYFRLILYVDNERRERFDKWVWLATKD